MLRRARYCYGKVVRPYVRDVELSWSHRLEIFKIFSRLVNLRCSLSADLNIGDVLQREHEHPKTLTQSDPSPVELSVADIRWQYVPERSEIAQWSQWRAYRKPTSLFPMVRSTTPCDFPEKLGSQMHLSYVISNFEWPYLHNGSSDHWLITEIFQCKHGSTFLY